MSLRIAVLMARHGAVDHANALDDLNQYYATQMPGVERQLVVCDNTLPPGYAAEIAPGTVLIGAADTAREFSSLDAGIAFLGAGLMNFDYVHLTTSAFRQLYTAYIERISLAVLHAVRGRGVAIGHIDRYNEPTRLFGRSTQSWLRSSFVFLPPTELRLLGSLVSVTRASDIFSGDPANPFRADAPLDANLRANIIGWLTGAGTGQGVEWHSRFALTPQTLPTFEAKTLAILNELSFSIRLREQGCLPVDATWLAGALSGASLGDVFAGVFPPWQVQLAERPVDAVPLEPGW
ncbi:hypothetical protein [Ancylobacter amanitiformis]|uniref:Uncharacterized protein n=1 Tax=Ancylobacter amanitiformis TaxID=217069 RepID=A0ABU0LVH1_9HYPH|nr:hypothetical protein [Ancylobacter amanitiformis]MDQ0512608.1 hypothetical protein [Ancylobacter amanitiformis]